MVRLLISPANSTAPKTMRIAKKPMSYADHNSCSTTISPPSDIGSGRLRRRHGGGYQDGQKTPRRLSR